MNQSEKHQLRFKPNKIYIQPELKINVFFFMTNSIISLNDMWIVHV